MDECGARVTHVILAHAALDSQRRLLWIGRQYFTASQDRLHNTAILTVREDGCLELIGLTQRQVCAG